MKSLVVALAMFTAASGLVAADHWNGTWKMNVEKSRFSPGPGPKSGMTTYSKDGEWTVVKTESVDAMDKTTRRNHKYKADGKEYPYENSNGRGMISVTREDDLHSTGVFKFDGGHSVRIKTVFSSDGKTRTQTVTGTNAKGEKVDNTIVYERQ